jgi:hypothetical protein
MNIPEALASLRPGANWSLNGNTYKGLVWYGPEETKPTEEEVNQEIERLKAEYNNNQYQRDRGSAYPSIQDQLDTLYHQGYDGWKEMINEVKNKYPKP